MYHCVANNRFYKLGYLHLYLLFFIPLYAKIRCQQHSLTYHSIVTVRLILFISVVITAHVQFTKQLDYPAHWLTRLPTTWFYYWMYLNCISLGVIFDCSTHDVIRPMTLVTQLTQTSFKTTIYTINNQITANIASHKCQRTASLCISAVLDVLHWL